MSLQLATAGQSPARAARQSSALPAALPATPGKPVNVALLRLAPPPGFPSPAPARSAARPAVLSSSSQVNIHLLPRLHFPPFSSPATPTLAPSASPSPLLGSARAQEEAPAGSARSPSPPSSGSTGTPPPPSSRSESATPPPPSATPPPPPSRPATPPSPPMPLLLPASAPNTVPAPSATPLSPTPASYLGLQSPGSQAAPLLMAMRRENEDERDLLIERLSQRVTALETAAAASAHKPNKSCAKKLAQCANRCSLVTGIIAGIALLCCGATLTAAGGGGTAIAYTVEGTGRVINHCDRNGYCSSCTCCSSSR
jgi:hypothetical protein